MPNYSVEEIRNKKSTSQALSAGEQAIASRRDFETLGNDMAFNGDFEEREQAQSEEVGFFGWFKRLFSKKIQFDFHGTPITGKAGYQVRGGRVPLFSGVVLDLTPAFMKGEIDQQGNSQVNLVPGNTNPQLYVSPTGSGEMKGHEINEMTLISKGSEGVEFSAKAKDVGVYENQFGKITAKSLVVKENSITFEDAKLTVPDQGELDTTAAIDEQGLFVDLTPLRNKLAQKAEAAKGKLGDKTDTLEENKENKQQQLSQEIESADRLKKLGELKEKQAKLDELRRKKMLLEQQTKEQRRKSFHFNFGKSFLDSEEEEEEENEEAEGLSIFQQLAARDRNIERIILKKAREQYTSYKNQAAEIYEKLGFAKDAVLEMFKTGKLPDNKYDNEKEEDSKGKLSFEAGVDILPGLRFVASLQPAYSFGMDFNISGSPRMFPENFEIDAVCDEESETAEIKNMPVFDYGLKFDAGFRGHLSAALKLGLQAGFGYIANVTGNLMATGTLGGIKDENNTFASAEAVIGVKKHFKDSKPVAKIEGVDLGIEAGLKGSVGAELVAASQLFDWEKEIASYTFKEWDIAGMRMGMSLAPKEVAGDSLKEQLKIKNWEKKNSFYDINILGSHIRGEKGDFGIHVNKEAAIDFSAEHANATAEGLEYTIQQLKNFQSMLQPKDGNYVAPDSVKYQELMESIQNSLAYLNHQIHHGTIEIDDLQNEIDAFLKSKDWERNFGETDTAIKKHQGRVNAMEAWSAQYDADGKKSEDKESAALEEYRKLSGGAGFIHSRKDEAREEITAKLTNRDELVKFELQQQKEASKKHNERISELENYLSEHGVGAKEMNQPNAGFVSFYRKLGAKELFTQLGEFNNTQGLLEFAKARKTKDMAVLDSRVDDLLKKAYEKDLLAASERKELEDQGKVKRPKNAAKLYEHGEEVNYVSNKEFWEYYSVIYGGQEILKHLWDADLNPQKLWNYEVSRLRDEDGNYNEREIRKKQLRDLQKEKAKAADDVSKAQIDAKARELFYKQSQFRFEKDKVSVISIADIFEHEKSEQEKVLQNIPKDESERKSNVKEWANSMKNSESILNEISLEQLQEFERSKTEELAKIKDKNQANMEEYHLHVGVLHKLDAGISGVFFSSDQKKALAQAKKDYITYYTSRNKEVAYTDALQKGDLYNDELMKLSLAGKGEVYDDRLAKLREFMGLPKDSDDYSLSTKDDAQVAGYYFDVLKAGKELKEKLKGRNFDSYTVEDLLRHENYEQRSKNEKHYDRLQMIERLMDQGEINPKEYYEGYTKLGGGAGFNEHLQKATRVGNATVNGMIGGERAIPAGTILKYEKETRRRIEEEFNSQIQIIEDGIATNIGYDTIKSKYRAAVLASQKHFSKEHLAHLSFLKLTFGLDFEDKVDINKVATPQVIMDYENRRKGELEKPHIELRQMVENQTSNEEAWKKYREMGGGSAFLTHMENRISEGVKTRLNGGKHYEDIMSHENSRIAYYQERMKRVQEPLNKLENAKKNLQEKVTLAEALRTELAPYNDQGKTAFSSAAKFKEFTSKGQKLDTLKNDIEKTTKSIEQEKAKIDKEDVKKAASDLAKEFEKR